MSGKTRNVFDRIGRRLGFQCVRGHTFYASALGPGSIVIDLGACKGDFSRHIEKEFGSRVFAVEASLDLFTKVRESPALSKLNYAVSDHDGMCTFYDSTKETAGNILAPKPNSTGKVQEVRAIRLPSLMGEIGARRIDLLKVDIEGAEIQLFNDVKRDDISQIMQITVEFHDSVRYPNVTSRDVEKTIAGIRSMGFAGTRMGRRNYDWLFVNKRNLRLPFHIRSYLRARRYLN